MPANHVYAGRVKKMVDPYTGCPITYGFSTNVPEAIGTACGHQAIPANVPPNLVYGANSPKPGRATSKGATGTRSSFYDRAKYAALVADPNWSVTLPRRRSGAGNSTNSVAVYVRVGLAAEEEGRIKYGWRMPSFLHAKLADELGALGIKLVTAADNDVVWGVDYPKPPKASKIEVGEDGTNTLTTFVATGAALPAGWVFTGGERVAP